MGRVPVKCKRALQIREEIVAQIRRFGPAAASRERGRAFPGFGSALIVVAVVAIVAHVAHVLPTFIVVVVVVVVVAVHSSPLRSSPRPFASLAQRSPR